MWNLTVRGPFIPTQRRVLAEGSVLSLGRADDNDVVLPAESVSRRNTRFRVGAEGLRVTDLGSRNGTQLNGRPLVKESGDITPGDVVQIGDYVITFEPVQAAPPPPVSSPAHPRRGGGRPSQPEERTLDGFVTLRTSDFANNPFMKPADEGTDTAQAPEPRYAPMLFQLAERLASGMPADAFLHRVLGCAEEVSGFEGGVILAQGDGGYALAPPEKGSPGKALLWSSTILQAAVERRSTLFVHHLRMDPRFNAANSVILGGYLHVICAPLVRGAKALGALYLCTRTAEPPSQGTVDFISSIAQLGAAAVEREHRSMGVTVVEESPTGAFSTGKDAAPDEADAELVRGTLDSLAQLLGPRDANAPAVNLSTVRDLIARAKDAITRLAS